MASRMKGSERRASVLHAAAEEFARGGFFETTMTDVAVRAGVSQPYVQRLFGSKHDLFLAAVDLAFDDVVEALTRTLGQPDLDQPLARAEVLAAHAQLMTAGTSMHLLAQAIAARSVDRVRDLLVARGQQLRVCLERAGYQGSHLEQLTGELLLRTACALITPP